MLKLTVLTLILVCALVLLSGAEAQRINPGDGGGSSGTSNAVPVVVSNFPTAQTVTGMVSVGNFPLTVNVTGAVDVRNLPFDEEGNLRVSSTNGAPPAFRFLGITTGTVAATFKNIDADRYPVLECNRVCQAEFPGTRICLWQEMSRSIPTPNWSECVLMAGSLDYGGAACYDASGKVQYFDSTFDPRPVACCAP